MKTNHPAKFEIAPAGPLFSLPTMPRPCLRALCGERAGILDFLIFRIPGKDPRDDSNDTPVWDEPGQQYLKTNFVGSSDVQSGRCNSDRWCSEEGRK